MSLQVLILLGTLGMLILAFAVIFMMMFHQRRVIRHQLEMRDKDLQSQKESLLASIHGQESERKRIAEDLHDEVGALLSCVKLNVGQLQKLSNGTDSHSELAGDTKEILDNVIQQVRAISRNLHPSTLVKFGIAAALREFCELIDRSGAIKTSFSQQEDLHFEISKDKELMLFRVVQELCNNIMKYAGATTLDFYLEQDADKNLQLSIEDNGTGFSQEDFERFSQANGSLGLKNIANRLDLIHGQIRFEPLPGQGTRTSIAVKTAGSSVTLPTPVEIKSA